MPFTSLEVSPSGTCKVCCKILVDITKSESHTFNVLTNDIDEIWQSSTLKDLRNKFLRNERPDECQLCWTEEAANIKSLRLQAEYSVVNIKNPEITQLSLKLSNKCNLACRICSPQLSSLWQSQHVKLGLPLFPINEFKTIDLEKFQGERLASLHRLSHSVKQLLIYGGEPLINDEVITYLNFLITSNLSKNIHLVLNTNTTICNDEIIEILSKFNTVHLFLSIDDVDKRFEYQRWPGKWSKISKNIETFSKLPAPFIVEFYPTLSIFNIMNIDDILTRLTSFNIGITFNNIIHDPQILSIRNLPVECKKSVISYIRGIDFSKFNLNKDYPDFKDSILKFIELDNIPSFNLSKIEFGQQLQQYLNIHDEFRKTPMKEYLPNLYTLIYED